MVYILTKEPFPVGMAATNRIKCLAKAFLSYSIDCEIVLFGRTHNKEDYPPSGIEDGIPYFFIGNSVKRATGNINGRLQSLLLYIKLLFFLAININKNDVIYDYSGSISNIQKAFIIFITHLKKALYVYELCELPAGTGDETKKAMKKRKEIFKFLFPIFDGVVAISDELVFLAKQYCRHNAVIVKVPILVDFEKYYLPDLSNQTDWPYIFHSGTLYEQKDGILGMIEAFGIAYQKNSIPFRFILTGELQKSPHAEQIRMLITKYHLENNLFFVGYLTDEGLKDFLSKSSLVIINKPSTLQNKYCFSTKLGEYMAAGKPIVITRVGEAMNWLTDKKDCIIIEPDNIEQLADAIVYVYKHQGKMSMVGKEARETCKHSFDYHNYSSLLSRMINEMQSA